MAARMLSGFLGVLSIRREKTTLEKFDTLTSFIYPLDTGLGNVAAVQFASASLPTQSL